MNQEYEMINQIMLSTTRMDEAYYHFSHKIGIKENTLTLIYALDDGQPHSQKQICQDWLIPKTTLNTNVKELVEAGYISFLPGKNGREKKLILTESGKLYSQEILKEVYAAEEAAIKKTLAKFSPEFVEALAYFSACICQELQERAVKKVGEEL